MMTRAIARGLIGLLIALGGVSAAGAAVPDDAYIAGYAAAVLEREFRLTPGSLRVEKGVIRLAAGDLAGADRERIVSALSAIRGVAAVEVAEPVAGAGARPREAGKGRKDYETGALPGDLLFKPLIADPRWPHFGASYQGHLHDKQPTNMAAVSLGETFTLFRDRVGEGWWEVGIQAGVFALFDLDAFSKDLVNADYFVAVLAAYRHGDFSALTRLFHQSSHLGDEFLLRSRVNRVNLSYEGVDLKLSYDFGDVVRVYGGAGYLFHRDPSSLKPWSLQSGLEFRSPWPPAGRLRPIAAVDLQSREENSWNLDLSLRAGVQIDGILPARNLQILLEYFRGRSPNGQFYKDKVEYLGLGVHFHF